MVRKLVPGAGALALGLGLVVASGGGTAGATQVPVTFTGAIHCSAFGLFKFSPRLTDSGGAPEVMTLRVTLSGCTGAGTTQGGATLSGGHLIATSTTAATDSCGAALNGTTLPHFTGTVTWKTSGGPAVVSTVSLTNGAVYYNSSLDTLTTYLSPTATAGSYAGETLSFSGLTSNAPAYRVTASCGAHGLGSLRFGKSAGSIIGSVDVGA